MSDTEKVNLQSVVEDELKQNTTIGGKRLVLNERIENDYRHHPPTPEKQILHEKVREAYKTLAYAIEELVPNSREKSVAMTLLEQSMFEANAGIARNPLPEQKTGYDDPQQVERLMRSVERGSTLGTPDDRTEQFGKATGNATPRDEIS